MDCRSTAELFSFIDSLALPEMEDVRLSGRQAEASPDNVAFLDRILQTGTIAGEPPPRPENRALGAAVAAAAISGAIAGALSPVPGGIIIGAIGAGISAAVTTIIMEKM